MGREEQHDTAWSLGFILFMVMILVVLVTETGRGLDQRYVSLFTGIFIAGIVGLIVLLFYSKIAGIEDDEYTPTIISSSETRPLSGSIWFKIGAIIFLGFIFVGGSAVTQSSLIPIIDPFDSTNLVTTANINTISGTFINSTRSGIYPGVGEDIIGFLFVTITTLGLLWLLRRLNDDANSIMPFVVVSGLLACGLWGLVFASAHLVAYGINSQAYTAAFLYGFISQFTNFLVGAPVSIIAHFFHNFTIIFTAGLALSIGGVLASTNVTSAIGALFMRPNNKKGNALIWTIIVVGIVFVLGIFYYLANNGQVFDIGTSCTDYTTIPNTHTCTGDNDCINQIVPDGKPLDNGILVRCNQGTCEAKFQTCSGSVS